MIILFGNKNSKCSFILILILGKGSARPGAEKKNKMALDSLFSPLSRGKMAKGKSFRPSE